MFYMILAGGSGTRLFPMSRPAFPKQFLDLDGNGPLIERTLRRTGGEHYVLIGGSGNAHLLEEAVKRCPGLGEGGVLIEPAPRNTAPAILFGLTRVPGGETVVVMPADHRIKDTAALARDLAEAERLASRGYIVTLGIVPDGPETGYGYIRTGPRISAHGREVEAFVEKPDVETAERYVSSGEYLWNSGMFVFKKEVMLAEAAGCSDDLRVFLERLASGDGESAYGGVTPVSLDYAVMERTARAAVVEASFDWTDVGSWSSVKEMRGGADENTVMSGELVSVESAGNLVSAPGKKVILAGVERLEVIDTGDVLLVGSLERSQLVKDAAEAFGERFPLAAKSHGWEIRPWGTFATLYEGDGYKVKRITVKKGEMLSLQYHEKRAEDWVIVRGSGLMHLDGKEYEVRAGDHVHIPTGSRHTVTAAEELEFVETQTGSYLGEDDIVRIKDKYGRK